MRQKTTREFSQTLNDPKVIRFNDSGMAKSTIVNQLKGSSKQCNITPLFINNAE